MLRLRGDESIPRRFEGHAELKSEGGILDRHFLQLNSHVINHRRRVDDSSLERLRMIRGVLARLGMGWFGGLITRKSQERTKDLYDYYILLIVQEYCVHLEADRRTADFPN